MGKISFSTGKGRSPRRSKCKGTVELEPKGPDELASRDVPAFPREERHHRAPVGMTVKKAEQEVYRDSF